MLGDRLDRRMMLAELAIQRAAAEARPRLHNPAWYSGRGGVLDHLAAAAAVAAGARRGAVGATGGHRRLFWRRASSGSMAGHSGRAGSRARSAKPLPWPVSCASDITPARRICRGLGGTRRGGGRRVRSFRRGAGRACRCRPGLWRSLSRISDAAGPRPRLRRRARRWRGPRRRSTAWATRLVEMAQGHRSRQERWQEILAGPVRRSHPADAECSHRQLYRRLDAEARAPGRALVTPGTGI